jgi:nucleotide-binding universal stress UspA family protein
MIFLSQMAAIKKILVPLDGSAFSFAAARYAISIAKQSGAEIELLHAIANPPYTAYPASEMLVPRYIDEAKAEANRWFNDVKDLAEKQNVKVSSESVFNVLSVADSIVNYAHDHKIDLIVIGTRGQSAIKRFLLGSVANAVVAHAGCPVLVVR